MQQIKIETKTARCTEDQIRDFFKVQECISQNVSQLLHITSNRRIMNTFFSMKSFMMCNLFYPESKGLGNECGVMF